MVQLLQEHQVHQDLHSYPTEKEYFRGNENILVLNN